MKIRRNLSDIDRYIRGVVGIATFALGIFGNTIIGEPLLQGFLIIFGVLNLISLTTGWCAVYHIANLSTYTKNND